MHRRRVEEWLVNGQEGAEWGWMTVWEQRNQSVIGLRWWGDWILTVLKEWKDWDRDEKNGLKVAGAEELRKR